METSGLMVFARGIDSQRAISRAFEQRAVSKYYVAVTYGLDRKSTRLNSSHERLSRMPSSA